MEKLRILVMDDEEMLLRTLRLVLPMEGYDVETALDGKAAAELYRKAQAENRPFAAAILDINVPAGSVGAVGAAQEIRKVDPQAKLIASSGDSYDQVMQNFKDYGLEG